jgi:hypothetical protein
MTLAPPLWATGSWATDAWANGTWATSVVVVTHFDDLTTVFIPYLASLAAAHGGTDDPGTQLLNDLATVRAATHSPDDMNTMYAEYCSAHF